MGYFSKKRRSPSRESVDVTAWPNSERIPLALALSTASERGGAVAGNPSSDSLQYDVKERLSRHALDHHIDIFFVSSKESFSRASPTISTRFRLESFRQEPQCPSITVRIYVFVGFFALNTLSTNNAFKFPANEVSHFI